MFSGSQRSKCRRAWASGLAAHVMPRRDRVRGIGGVGLEPRRSTGTVTRSVARGPRFGDRDYMPARHPDRMPLVEDLGSDCRRNETTSRCLCLPNIQGHSAAARPLFGGCTQSRWSEA